MKWIMIIAALAISGCASIVDGRKQEVEIQTAGTQCARCELSNSKGTYHSSCTPQKVTVKRAYGPLSVSCSAAGLSGKTEAESSIKGWFFGNILIGGLIGMGIDAGTGSAWDYPDAINVQMIQASHHQQGGYTPVQPAPVQMTPQTEPATSPVYSPAPTPGQPAAASGYKPLYQPQYPAGTAR